jgi:hypothetical protein
MHSSKRLARKMMWAIPLISTQSLPRPPSVLNLDRSTQSALGVM